MKLSDLFKLRLASVFIFVTLVIQVCNRSVHIAASGIPGLSARLRHLGLGVCDVLPRCLSPRGKNTSAEGNKYFSECHPPCKIHRSFLSFIAFLLSLALTTLWS